MTRADPSPSASELQVHIQYRLLEALQEREHQLAEAQRLAHMGSWVWEVETGSVEASDEFYRLLGRTPDGSLTRTDTFIEAIRTDQRKHCAEVINASLRDGTRCTFDCAIESPGSTERWLRIVADVDVGSTGRATRMHGVAQDITQQHHAEEAARGISEMFRAMVENSPDILTCLNEDSTIRYTSPTIVLGYPLGSKLGTDIFELVHPDDVETVVEGMARLRQSTETAVCIELRLAHADGSWRTFETSGRNLLHEADVSGFLFTSRDISDRKEAEQRLQHERTHDHLTGLPNKPMLTRLAIAAMARGTRRGWTTALVAVDIDDFRVANDRAGIEGGDRILREVAHRLVGAFRPSDAVGRPIGEVGRFAGDTFLVVCEGAEVQGALVAICRRIADVFEAPFVTDQGDLALSASVGVAVAPPGTSDFDGLLQNAESALRTAKASGGGACQAYDQDHQSTGLLRSGSAARLRQALVDGELRLYFQPKVSLTTNLIVGAEGLLRWEHPERGLVPPLDFIPLAEESGLIVPIGAWVIEEACRQAARWAAAFPDRPPLLVCVNVSARQFGPELVGTVASALTASGLPASGLGLEVTESILMHDVDQARFVLHELQALGVTLSIDDFGTGYSSLAYLKQFDLHELKIDRSFVDGLGRDPNDTSIVAAVVALSHALDLAVVAEGVETVDQRDRLRSLGCEVGQGYLFARPAPAAAMDELLSAEATASWTARGLDLPENDAASGRYRAERVLVVDDSAEIRQLAHMTLAAVGFEVYEAEDGALAVEMARTLRPECILLDVVMGDFSGLDACRALRADPVTADCTIVMVTANDIAADKIEAFSAGADDYLIKPFSPRDLSARIRAAMRRRSDAASVGDPPTTA